MRMITPTRFPRIGCEGLLDNSGEEDRVPRFTAPQAPFSENVGLRSAGSHSAREIYLPRWVSFARVGWKVTVCKPIRVQLCGFELGILTPNRSNTRKPTPRQPLAQTEPCADRSCTNHNLSHSPAQEDRLTYVQRCTFNGKYFAQLKRPL